MAQQDIKNLNYSDSKVLDYQSLEKVDYNEVLNLRKNEPGYNIIETNKIENVVDDAAVPKLNEPVWNTEAKPIFNGGSKTSYGKSSVGAKKYSDYQWYENEVEVTQKASRSKNKISPNSNAAGNHVVYKKDPVTGKITNYKVYEVNPHNPTGFDEIIGYDGIGKPHMNPVTKEKLLPHVHDNMVSGKVRVPYPDEIPE